VLLQLQLLHKSFGKVKVHTPTAYVWYVAATDSGNIWQPDVNSNCQVVAAVRAAALAVALAT